MTVRASWLLVLAACAPDDIPPPHVSSITPSSAPAGAVVMIAGSGFCHQADPGPDGDPFACKLVGAPVFGSTQASAIQYQDTLIQAEVPTLQSGVVNVSVEVGGAASNSVDFTIE